MFALDAKVLLLPLLFRKNMDIASILMIATGFALGLVHSFDPDHIVAVSALLCSSNSLRKSIVSATAWGAGHSAVLFLVGGLFLALKVELPDSLVSMFEFGAGLMLVILGVAVVKPILVKTYKNRKGNNLIATYNQFGNNEKALTHSHVHDSNYVHRSVLTGVLQGLAGSAALMLATLTTVSSFEIGLFFILLFAAGVIMGMVCISCLIGSLLKFTASHLEKIHEKIRLITGLVSVVFGIYIVMQVALTHHF